MIRALLKILWEYTLDQGFHPINLIAIMRLHRWASQGENRSYSIDQYENMVHVTLRIDDDWSIIWNDQSMWDAVDHLLSHNLFDQIVKDIERLRKEEE